MSIIRISCSKLHTRHRLISNNIQRYSTSTQAEDSLNDEEFRVLNIRQVQVRAQPRKRVKKQEVPLVPRIVKMPVDQDWGSVWPGPKTFHPSSVPLPIHQGYTEKNAPPPSKYANAELMKIPNFLHLTPPVIKKQCEALKKFCTPWPKGLETESKCEKYFPVQVITSDYCHALPTIRNPMARIVSIKLKLSNLKFDKHSRDKFLRLVGDRYNAENDVLTIVTDRCPLRKQNYDYAQYLLTALYHESWITEPWEAMKSEADMEYFDFASSKSKKSAEAIINWRKSKDEHVSVGEEFGKSVSELINDGENDQSIRNYKEAVIKLLGLKSYESTP